MSAVENFIRQFQNEGTIRTFTEGCCYWFAHILSHRFPGAEIYYNPILNHFAARIADSLWDITGELPATDAWVKWDAYKESEPLDAERVEYYCIDKKRGRENR